MDSLPDEILLLIPQDMESFRQMLAAPRFARQLTPNKIIDYMIMCGCDVRVIQSAHGNSCIHWLLNGLVHREGAPAVDHEDGYREYYMNGCHRFAYAVRTDDTYPLNISDLKKGSSATPMALFEYGQNISIEISIICSVRGKGNTNYFSFKCNISNTFSVSFILDIKLDYARGSRTNEDIAFYIINGGNREDEPDIIPEKKIVQCQFINIIGFIQTKPERISDTAPYQPWSLSKKNGKPMMTFIPKDGSCAITIKLKLMCIIMDKIEDVMHDWIDWKRRYYPDIID